MAAVSVVFCLVTVAVCVVFTVFYDEVTGTLERALSEGISTDNMVLEINSVK